MVEKEGHIQVFYLPSYSPDLNPDEKLNQDVKSNAAVAVDPIPKKRWFGMFDLICIVANGVLRLSKDTLKQNLSGMRLSKRETILCSP